MGPASPMPGWPTENRQIPWPGVALRRARECKRRRRGGLSSLIEPIRPQKTERLDGGKVCLGEKHMKHFCVELKVCEGCGGLWIRAQNHGVYCRACALMLSEFPAPRQRSRAGRPRTRLVVCAGAKA